MTTIVVDTAQAERLDLALELYFEGTCETLEEAEHEAALLLADVPLIAASWDSFAAELGAAMKHAIFVLAMLVALLVAFVAGAQWSYNRAVERTIQRLRYWAAQTRQERVE